MDSHYFEYGVGLSYSSYPGSTAMFRPFEFDSINSTPRPFSTHFDTTDTFSKYCDSNEQYSSTDTLSQATPSSNSIDYNSYFHQSGDFSFYLQDSSLINTGGPFFRNVDDDQRIRHALQELESDLMAADDHEEVITSEPFFGEIMHFHRPSSPPTTVKHLLIACAEALSGNTLFEFDKLVEHTRSSVSFSGEPIQRLGAYILEGLIARKESSGTNIYRALKCREPDSKDLLSYMHVLYEVCPYWKFSYMAANGAIAEACKNEDRIHIVDFQIRQGTQWFTLLQALASRPGGAPHVRITGIDDQVSEYAQGDGLVSVGERFAAISTKFNIPVEFHAVPVLRPDLTVEMLDIRPGEALAVNFPLLLHHTPDESVDVSNPRDGLIRMVKSLSPKVVTLIEQESNTNTAAFLPRFVETLDFYSAMFESIDANMPGESNERINMEQHCLGREIVNLIACEGKERVECHEMLEKWRLRFMMAGFRELGLSCYVNSAIRGLLKSYSGHYMVVEKDGAMLLGWKDRNLISVSAWH